MTVRARLDIEDSYVPLLGGQEIRFVDEKQTSAFPFTGTRLAFCPFDVLYVCLQVLAPEA